MIHRFAVAIGAGCAAAFLFAVSAQASPLAMTLAYLAPLPIMIATMGWGVDAGAAAAATSVAGLTLIILAEPLTGLLYAASVAAPAWMLAACAAAPLARYLPSRLRAGQTYASVGSIVVLAAAIGMIGAVAVLTAIIVIYGGYAEGAKQVATALAALVERRLRRQGRRSGAGLRRDARALRPGRDRGLDPPHAEHQSLRGLALDPALASAAKAVARSADLATSALAARRPRGRLRRLRLRPARSGVAIFLDRRRRARRGVRPAGARRRARPVARPQTQGRDARRALRLLRAAGQVHASRPRGARPHRRASPGCAPARPSFLPRNRPVIDRSR